MARNEIFVAAYRLEAYDNYDALDGFMEAICDYAIISKENRLCAYSSSFFRSLEPIKIG